MHDSRLISALVILLTSIILSLVIIALNIFAGNNSIISYLLCSMPVIISLFYLGASYQLASIEKKMKIQIDQENGEIITERMSYINMLISRGKNAVQYIDNEKNIDSISFHNDNNHINVLKLKSLIQALETRLDNLVEISKNMDLEQAKELSLAPLEFFNSSIYSIENTKIPNLEYEKWEEYLNDLVSNLKVKKAA